MGGPMNFLQEPQKFALQRIDDWNRHDLKAILAHYSEDIEFCSPFIVKLMGNPEGTLRGKKDLEDYFLRGLKAYPDLHFDWVDTLVGVGSLIIYYRSVNGLFAAEFMVFNEEGEIIRSVAHYRDPA
jgi:hypothetical protein